jgi:recombination protein RecR
VYDGVVQELIDELGRLPGVGPKSAQRIAFFLIESDEDVANKLSEVLSRARDTVKFCDVCGNVAEDAKCSICSDARRDRTLICVVEESKDIQAIERTREYRGLYHVLGGAINPIAGIGPDQLRIRQLLGRLADSEVREVILATNPNLEGEATATYLARTLSALEIPISKLASGLPVGGDLEYADDITLGRAFEGRRRVN